MRIKVIHRTLGVFYGDLLKVTGDTRVVRLDATGNTYEFWWNYVSDAQGDCQDETQMRRAS